MSARRASPPKDARFAMRAAFAALFAVAGVSAAQSSELNGFDLSGSLIDPERILRGGPPRDGIPAIDDPKFVAAGDADLADDDRLIGVFAGSEAKAYPLSILNWHEVVNDTVGGRPLAVTFCPLCGTGIVFAGEEGGRPLTFGVSGLLYNSDVLLYDRQSESLWSQILAQAVTGPRKGDRLTVVPSRMTSWADWRARHPDTLVLSESTGHDRNYGYNPYADYLQSPQVYFPVANTSDEFHPKEIVLGIEVDGKFKAYPASELEKAGGEPFVEMLNGKELRIAWDPASHSASIVDAQDGEYPFVQGFWFAWHAFHPDSEIYRSGE